MDGQNISYTSNTSAKSSKTESFWSLIKSKLKPETVTYVLDTTVLMDNPVLVHDIEGKIIIPLAVVEQLEELKNSTDEKKASKARKALKAIKKVKATVYTEYNPVDGLSGAGKVVGAAVRLKETGEKNLTLLTADVNISNMARGYGVKSTVVAELRKDNLRAFAMRLAGAISGALGIVLFESMKILAFFLVVSGVFLFVMAEKLMGKYGIKFRAPEETIGEEEDISESTLRPGHHGYDDPWDKW